MSTLCRCLGLAVLLVLASPVHACDGSAGFLVWERCWSPLRFGVWLVTLLPAAWLAYQVFRNRLEPSRSNPLWPRTALGRSMALWWLLAGASFLVLFAILWDDLRQPGWHILPPGAFGNFINLHWQWLLVLAVTLGGAWLITWSVRHHDARTA
jgi:hypothetical protein